MNFGLKQETCIEFSHSKPSTTDGFKVKGGLSDLKECLNELLIRVLMCAKYSATIRSRSRGRICNDIINELISHERSSVYTLVGCPVWEVVFACIQKIIVQARCCSIILHVVIVDWSLSINHCWSLSTLVDHYRQTINRQLLWIDPWPVHLSVG